jgi:hypothetical protein
VVEIQNYSRNCELYKSPLICVVGVNVNRVSKVILSVSLLESKKNISLKRYCVSCGSAAGANLQNMMCVLEILK